MDNKESTTERDNKHFWSKWCQNGCQFWCRKYFWEGQLQRGGTTDTGQASTIETAPPGTFSRIELTPARRKLIASITSGIVFNFCWWAIMIKKNLWHLFEDKYPMTITMLFASTIAGMTSKGGGAVAFPVMTLVMNVTPSLARDFAVMIQCFGMGSASFGIIFMKVHLEIYALLCCLLGGIVGIIIGIEVIDQYLTPSMKKMGFVSIWFSFTFALFLLNRRRKRKTFNNIPYLNWWKMLLLVFGGITGGIITALCGSGVDICCYALLTLFFRVSEKVATPTSVVLMALISAVGFFWRGLIMMQISQAAWEFVLVCIPLVVFGGPIGSLLGSHFHRLVLASLVHVIDIVALIGAFAIVPQTPALAGGSVGVIVVGAITFFVITKIGEHMMNYYEKQEELKKEAQLKEVTTAINYSKDKNDSCSNGTDLNVKDGKLQIDCEKGIEPKPYSNGISDYDIVPNGSTHHKMIPNGHNDTQKVLNGNITHVAVPNGNISPHTRQSSKNHTNGDVQSNGHLTFYTDGSFNSGYENNEDTSIKL